MHIIAYDPYVSSDRARRLGVSMLTLEEVLATADVITIHLPRTPKTENLIDANSMARMKDGVRIVNVARGGIVNEADLAAAVESGKVGGAAIDVFATEPTTESPLFSVENVTVTPHLGASTTEAQGKAGVAVAEAVAQALRGELVLSAVNLDLGPAVSPTVKPFIGLAEQLGKIFTALAKGLPSTLTVTVRGEIAEESTKPIALSALKGALAASTEIPVSYVNAPLIAEARGVSVIEESQLDVEDYQSIVRLSGEVNGRQRTVAGTYMARKGAVLIGLEGYAIEVPITMHMLLIRNEDVPGCIGRVGTYLGENGYNIADMVVGRSPEGTAAMMGIALDSSLDRSHLAGLLALDGIAAARYVDL
jgi:D-3-phosphoglycerate dehydrogenase